MLAAETYWNESGGTAVPTDVPAPQKADLNPEQQSAFNDALRVGIWQEDRKIIELALKNGADPNILMFAGIAHKLPSRWERFVYENHGLDWGQVAVEFGADVNAANAAE